MHLYMAIFPLWWMSIIISRGRSHPEKLPAWSVNGLPINDRLRRYLARAVAWPEMDYKKALRKIETIHFFSG